MKTLVRDALEGHVTAKFLNNTDNFKPITAILTEAIDTREKTIQALHEPAGTTQTAKAAPAAPKQGR